MNESSYNCSKTVYVARLHTAVRYSIDECCSQVLFSGDMLIIVFGDQFHFY